MKKWGWILFLAPLAAYSQVENVQVEAQKQEVAEVAPAVVEAKENAPVADTAPSAEVKADEKEVAWNFEAISNRTEARELVSFASSYEPFIEVDSEVDGDEYIADEMSDEMDADYEASYEVTFEDAESDDSFSEQEAKVASRPKIVQRNVQESKKPAPQAKVAPKTKRSAAAQPQARQKGQAQVEAQKAPAPQAKVAPKAKRSAAAQQPSNAKQSAQPQAKQKKQAQVESQKAPAPTNKRQGMSSQKRAAAPEVQAPAQNAGKKRATAQRPLAPEVQAPAQNAGKKRATAQRRVAPEVQAPAQNAGKKRSSAQRPVAPEVQAPAQNAGKKRATAQRPAPRKQAAESEKQSRSTEQSVQSKKGRSAKAAPAQLQKNGKAQRKVADTYDERETYIPSEEQSSDRRARAHSGKRPASE